MKNLLVNEFYTPYGNGGAERSVQHLAESFISSNKSFKKVSLLTSPFFFDPSKLAPIEK
jgi:hypothetical protein